MADDAGERTEEASEKRREEFRERGEVARSKDAVSVLILFSAVAYFLIFGPWLAAELRGVLRRCLDVRDLGELTSPVALSLAGDLVVRMGLVLAPLVGMIVLVSILGNVAQVGFLFTTKPLEPDFGRLNFFTRFVPTFFSKAAIGNLGSSLAKIGVVATALWLTVGGDRDRLRALAQLPLPAALHFFVEKSLLMLTNVALILIAIALFDYIWSRYSLEEKMRMTRQEVKDESKEMEGNPQLKGALRRRAREIAQRKMRVAVPTADVIVNNPTHLSVALRYRQGQDAAPVVVAKGADLMALQIRKMAEAHGVPMVENIALARLLYKHVKVGKPVPAQFFRAVAEVLAFVYKLRARRGLPKRVAPARPGAAPRPTLARRLNRTPVGRDDPSPPSPIARP